MARKRETRVTKRSSSSTSGGRMSRQRVGRWASAAASSSSSTAALREMIDEGLGFESDQVIDDAMGEVEDMDVADGEEMEGQEDVEQPRDKGKGRLMEDEVVDDEVEEKCFPLMDLPTEIRLEIYRACLTRPHKILLSKVEQQPQPIKPREAEQVDYGRIPEDAEIIDLTGDDQRPVDEERLANVDSPQQVRAIRAEQVRRINSLRTLARSQSTQPPPRANSQVTLSVNMPSAGSFSNSSNTATGTSSFPHSSNRSHRRTAKPNSGSPTKRPGARTEDPLVISLLRASKAVYKEARDVLYSENIFDLDISTAVTSLAALHQRSRRHIKHVELEIPTYTEILERFSEIVRLSLRYCTGLKKFVIHTPFTLPGADGYMSSSNTTVYANGFDILRWLPQQCEVVLMGSKNVEIEAVVAKHLTLAKTQDKLAYARRQLISNDASVTGTTNADA